jgi:VanZ family protein
MSTGVWRALLWSGMGLAAYLAFGPAPATPPVEGGDKLQHAAAFAALAFAAARAYPAPGPAQWRREAWIALALLGYGVAIELVQSLVPGRTASLADAVADAAGVLLGLLLARWWRPPPEPGAAREG